jgi:hypothetical protein
MAKRQFRSNHEKKKPKADKNAAIGTVAFATKSRELMAAEDTVAGIRRPLAVNNLLAAASSKMGE